MIIFFDLGNTQLKWSVYDGGSWGDRGVLLPRGDSWLQDLPCIEPSACVFASVRNKSANEAIVEALSGRYGVVIEQLETRTNVAGVQFQYDNIRSLGVDRWLAVIAAANKYRGSSCVVDLGSAITVDFVSAQGRHGGGFILPGARMLSESLLVGTDRVRYKPTVFAGNSCQPGHSTEACVYAGQSLMLGSLIGGIELQAESVENTIVTGGDVGLFDRFAKFDFLVERNLVIEGMLYAYSDGCKH